MRKKKYFDTNDLVATGENLIPDSVNTSPDYFCTWQAQLYCCNDAGPQGQRDCLTEKNIFEQGKGAGWAYLYPDARKDLIFLMDDCWDVPIGGTINESPYYGSQILAADKFPSFVKPGVTNQEAMRNLSNKIKEIGWRGLGGWICIQESPLYPESTPEDYWKKRLLWADYADWLYWKIDWGDECRNYERRYMISELRRKYAPRLIAEQAMLTDLIPYADSFRTYDVFTLLAIPITMEKLRVCLAYDVAPGCLGYINCMDEVYIAAALGCAIDVTRHNMLGALHDGRPHPAFPALHRNLKTKMDEVTRTVRWHRIAPAFSVNGKETIIDTSTLTDSWEVVDQKSEIEAWWKYKDGDYIERSGPARISRGLPLPNVKPDQSGYIPYVVSALHPCGAVSIATLGRTMKRRFWTPICDISIESGSATLFGVFGYYNSLTLYTSAAKKDVKVLMQDLLSDNAFDVTQLVEVTDGKLVIDGELIKTIGTMYNHYGDTSEPGVVISIS